MKFVSARVKRFHQALRCHQKALAALQLTPLRILLTRAQLHTLSSQAKGLYLEPGEVLYKNGAPGDFLAVLSKGTMKYENSLFERTPGDVVCDLDESQHRTRTIIAVTQTRLFIWKTFEIDQLHMTKIQPLISHISIKNSLMKSTLFSGLSPEQIDILCDAVHWRGADVNEIVIKEGDPGQYLYIVGQGLLKCFTGSATDLEDQMNLGNVASGDYIGEIALLIGIPRTASAMAVEPTCLMEIRATDFAHFIQSNLHVGEQIRNRIHVRIIMQFRQYRSTFFELLTDDQIHDLGPRCHLELIPSGKTLFRVGDVGDLFYMIVFGQVQLQLYNNDMTISTETLLNAGSYFGEVALRHDTPRYASAKTLTLCLFLTLSREQFSYLFKQQQLPLSARLPTSVEDLINVWRLLQTESGRSLLTMFASNRIAPEMLAFWFECDSFQKSVSNLNQEELVSSAKKIITLFLSKETSKDVGLPIIVKDQLLKALDKGSDIDGSIFNVAKFTIGRIVTSEVFPYLKHTELYAQLMGDESSIPMGSKSECWDEKKTMLHAPSSFNLESMPS